MKLPKHEFKRLQSHWYKKLADDGFIDIEKEKNGSHILIQGAIYPFRNNDSFVRLIKEEYFRTIGQITHDEKTEFRNEIDQYILIRYSDGARIKTIVEELILRGTPKERKTIRIIIRRYEMAWGIRYYNQQQLNVKPKNE